MRYIKLFFIFLFILPFLILSQTNLLNAQTESLRGLEINPALESKGMSFKNKADVGYSSLPFIDDFSGWPTPKAAPQWAGSSVFVNSSYIDTFISPGIATFDVLDNQGLLYDVAIDSLFRADSLVSPYFDLSDTTDIFLSFFYMAGGLGNTPEQQDSLVLQVYRNDTVGWYHWWSAEGGQKMLDFEQVVLGVPKVFYTDSFRFRFINYASYGNAEENTGKRGNIDLWHVDYVSLKWAEDANTAANMKDVTFVKDISPVFNFNYQAIPINHYNGSFSLADSLFAYIQAYVNDSALTNYKYTMTSNEVSPFSSEDYGNFDMLPDSVYTLGLPLDIDFFFGLDKTEPTSFTLKAYLFNVEVDLNRALNLKPNDTITKTVAMQDYYAYDDGIPENSYGFTGLSSNEAKYALKFRSMKIGGDQLKYIMIYFNPTLDSVTLEKEFLLKVWAIGDKGQPGTELYTSSRPQSIERFGYNQYFLEMPVQVPDSFFIGWEQTNKTYLNVGFDMNGTARDKAYYFANNAWIKSALPGLAMLRPGFGEKKHVTSVPKEKTANTGFKIYPNPASDYVEFDAPSGSTMQLQIFDVTGKIIDSQPVFDGYFSTSHLKEGMYFFVFLEDNAVISRNKLLIKRY